MVKALNIYSIFKYLILKEKGKFFAKKLLREYSSSFVLFFTIEFQLTEKKMIKKYILGTLLHNFQISIFFSNLETGSIYAF